MSEEPRMVVLFRNEDKGAITRKVCKNGCIGCSKCQKECPFDAIVVENNLAYIDFEKCRLCRKCEAVCPTGAIHAVNFPPRPQKLAEPRPVGTQAPAAQKQAGTPAHPDTTPTLNKQAETPASPVNVEKEVKA